MEASTREWEVPGSAVWRLQWLDCAAGSAHSRSRYGKILTPKYYCSCQRCFRSLVFAVFSAIELLNSLNLECLSAQSDSEIFNIKLDRHGKVVSARQNLFAPCGYSKYKKVLIHVKKCLQPLQRELIRFLTSSWDLLSSDIPAL